MSCYLQLRHTPSYESLERGPPGEPATSSPASSSLAPRPTLVSPADAPRSPAPGGTPGDPVAPMRSPALGLVRCRSFQRCTRVRRSHPARSQSEGRAQTSALATPRSDQLERAPVEDPNFQALGGIAPRPFVRPPAEPMLSTGGQYTMKRKKPCPEVCAWQSWGWEGIEDPETWLGVRRGLSPPAALSSALCGSPGVRFVLESPHHPLAPAGFFTSSKPTSAWGQAGDASSWESPGFGICDLCLPGPAPGTKAGFSEENAHMR